MENIRILIISLLLTSVFSCDITDTVPKDAITDLNYWKKVDDLKLYANSFYTALSGPNAGLDNTSDNIVTNTPNNWLFNNATIPGSGGGWDFGSWSTIRRLNYFMTHYHTVTGNQEDIDHYVAEIRFFRAWEYFGKVRTFGDVPWVDKDLLPSDDDILFKPRDPRKLVVDKIIEDLEYAAQKLKMPAQVASGRLHKFAALQLLARIALFEGTWMKYRGLAGWEAYLEKAVESSQRIMNEGGYSIVTGDAQYAYEGYPLSYRQQFIQQDLTGNKECVLPRIYQSGVHMHSLSREIFQSGVGASKDFIEDFLCIDGLPISLSPLYEGDDSLQMEMKNRDPRLRNMIDNQNLPYYIDGSTPISLPITSIAIDKCPTGYMPVKFRDPTPTQNEANQTSYDWFIFRYAEVLLIFAEAKAELGQITQDDIDKSINLLRARLDEPNRPMARLTLTPPQDPNSEINGKPRYGYIISPLLYEIRRERRIELAFEGFRWNDICRWNAGILIENPKTMLGISVNPEIVATHTKYNGGTNPFSDRSLFNIESSQGSVKQLLRVYSNMNRKWDDRLYLSPIPTDQLTLNPQLNQNPGWK